MNPGRALLALVLLFAACERRGDGVGDAEGEGPYSVSTIRAIDAVSREAAGRLLGRQLTNGSWGNDYAATALAAQALSSFEPPSPAHAAAAERAAGWLLKRPARSDADNYALAYAVAATTARPAVDDRSGLLGRGADLREGLERALKRDCGAFQAGVILNALGKTGLPKDRLKALAEAAAKRPEPRKACAGRLPDPANATARAYAAAMLAYNAGLPGPGEGKKNFDEIVRLEEFRAKHPTGPLGPAGFLWTSAGFREMRFRLVEPARGCYFCADLLGNRLLESRGKDGTWGGDAADASALLALINLRRTFEAALPYEKTR